MKEKIKFWLWRRAISKTNKKIDRELIKLDKCIRKSSIRRNYVKLLIARCEELTNTYHPRSEEDN